MSFALQILKDSASNGDTAGHPAFLLQWNAENFSYFSAGLIFSLVRFFCIKAKEMNNTLIEFSLLARMKRSLAPLGMT